MKDSENISKVFEEEDRSEEIFLQKVHEKLARCDEMIKQEAHERGQEDLKSLEALNESMTKLQEVILKTFGKKL